MVGPRSSLQIAKDLFGGDPGCKAILIAPANARERSDKYVNLLGVTIKSWK